jgi:hypothetical protein
VPVDLNEEHVLLFDSAGVEMAVQNGVAIPVSTRGYLAAGSDGANARFLITDTTGRQIAVGAAAAGAAPTGNPLLVSGSDGAAVRALLTDVGGRQIAVGAAAAAAAPIGNPVLVGGSDGVAVRTRLLDTSGRGIAVGAGATGAAVTGNPVLMAGSDGANARTLLTDAFGRLAITTTAGTPDSIMGEVSTNAQTRTAINATVYTNQSTNAQRSVSSTSANDTAAGTGARTIRITYYSIAAGVVTGPFTETITMNGVAAVNTVSTTIAFVEKIEVMTAGSGGVPAGVISIFVTTGGGGGAFGTLGSGSNVTRWSQHWVPSGKTCSIYSVYTQNTAASGNNPRITIDVFDVATVNAAERTIATYRIDGRTNMALGATTPINVVGPARIRAYVTPANNPVQITTFEARYIEA